MRHVVAVAGLGGCLLLGAITAQAQAPAAPSPAAPAAPVAAPPAAAAPGAAPTKSAAPGKSAAAKKCMRLPMSDIAFGQEETIKQARMRLDEYAADEAKKRGWGALSGLTKSNETASCEVYLVLPFAGTEYKCLVTTTFCTK